MDKIAINMLRATCIDFTIYMLSAIISTLFLCISAHCPILMNFTNGIVKMTGNSSGNFATYTCDPDYELVGTTILVCGKNRQWSAEPPICRRTYN